MGRSRATLPAHLLPSWHGQVSHLSPGLAPRTEAQCCGVRTYLATVSGHRRPWLTHGTWEVDPSRAELLRLPPRLAHQGLGWQRGPPCCCGRAFSGSSWVSCNGRTDMEETGRKSWVWLLCLPSLGFLLLDLRKLRSPTLEGTYAPEDTSQGEEMLLLTQLKAASGAWPPSDLPPSYRKTAWGQWRAPVQGRPMWSRVRGAEL